MNKSVMIGAGGILGAALWAVSRNAGQDDGSGGQSAIDEATQQAAELIDSLTGGSMRLSAMSQVTGAMVTNPNMQAFLRVIRRGEGTGDADGYRRMFGGELFASFADHPRKKITKSGYTSTAAGAYQFITPSWDETRSIMNLPDFSPASQDYAAVGRIAARGAIADVIAGRFAQAVAKCAKEWASLPGSPYGQPTISLSTAQNVYASNGGTFA